MITKKIDPRRLKTLCEAGFGDMVKVVVDIEREKIAVGGELHADAESVLLKEGSMQENLWGANFYPWNEPNDRIEFTALINIRPRAGNPSMEIISPNIRTRVQELVERFILSPDEKLVR